MTAPRPRSATPEPRLQRSGRRLQPARSRILSTAAGWRRRPLLCSRGSDAAILAILLAAPLFAQPELTFERLPHRIRLPVGLVDPGDGSNRLFAVSQLGRILVLDPDEGFPITLLNLEDRVSCCGEQGLLGLALHPNFTENGLFFVNYTSVEGEEDRSVLARYRISADDPNIADPASEAILLEVLQPTVGHNGGQIAFGADGYLYVTFGDGGLQLPSPDTSQDLASLLGKILRIDVDHGDPYAIPPTNPFVDVEGARPEIYLTGLRNPWRFSFDRENADLYIGDVGDGEWEEVSVEPGTLAGGTNFGWRIFEGSRCWKNAEVCFPGAFTPPILEYPHGPPNPCGYSVTGGYRYRGLEMPELHGAYIFGDYCTGEIWAATQTDGRWSLGEPLQTDWRISTFAEDSNGELYVANYAASEYYRIRSAPTAPVVSAVSPAVVSVDSTSVVTVSGQNFRPDSLGLWNGVEVPTELVDNHTLVLRPPAALVSAAGRAAVAVRTPDAGESEALTVRIRPAAAPAFPANGVVNAASFAPGPLSPGTIISIFGDPLAIADGAATFLPLPRSLGGATVLVNGEPVGLFSSSPGQLNLLLPGTLSGETATLTVQLGSAESTAEIPLSSHSPGVFTADASGSGQGAVTIAGAGCLAGPPRRGSCARPARTGDVLEIYATGLGPLVKPHSGIRAPDRTVTPEPAAVTIGGEPAEVLYSGQAPGFEGLNQVNARFGSNTPRGDAVELQLSIAGIRANPVTIAIGR